MALTSPQAQNSGSNFQQSRASVIKLAKNAEDDLRYEEQNDMGVQRLQMETTPLKRTALTPRQIAPLQNVPLNLTSPDKLPSRHVQENPRKCLPVPIMHTTLTVLENAPKNITTTEQLLSYQNLTNVHLTNAVSPPYVRNTITPAELQCVPKFENIQACFTTPPRRIISRAPKEEQDTLLGALALVELSQSPQ